MKLSWMKFSKSDKVKLTHYSRKSGLKSLDPNYMGSGAPSEELKNGPVSTKQVSFYREGVQPESIVQSGAKSKYTVNLSPDKKIYDIYEDPEGLVSSSVKEIGRLDTDHIRGTIKNAGYHGFHTTHPDYSKLGIVNLFHETPIDEEEVIGKADLEKGQRGDWKKEGYTIKYRKTDIVPATGSKIIYYDAHHPSGEVVGRYRFSLDENSLYPLLSETHPEHRRKGLASAAYLSAEKRFKKKVQPSSAQSDEAKALWDQPKRSFGKSQNNTSKSNLQRNNNISPNKLKPSSESSRINTVTEEDLMKANLLRDSLIAGAISLGAQQTANPVFDKPTQVVSQVQEKPKEVSASDFKQKMQRTIAAVESGNNHLVTHAPLSGPMHQGTSAIGRYGLTPAMIKDTIKLNPKKLGHLEHFHELGYEDMKAEMQKNPQYGHDIASAHLDRLIKIFGNNPKAIGFAWLSGITGTKKAIKNGKDLGSHWHVTKIMKEFNKVGSKK